MMGGNEMKNEVKFVISAWVVVFLSFGLITLARSVDVDKSKVKVERVRVGNDVIETQFLFDDTGTKVVIEKVRYVPGLVLHKLRALQADIAYWQAVTPDFVAVKLIGLQIELEEMTEIKNLANSGE